jgi:hypothetical protein
MAGAEAGTTRSLTTSIRILAGNIILRHLVCANFLLVGFPGVFHALHRLGLERVSLLEQLVHTLRIRTLDVGQSLQISRLLARPRSQSLQCGCHRIHTLAFPLNLFLTISAPAVFPLVILLLPTFVFISPLFGTAFFFANFIVGITLFFVSFFLTAYFIGASFSPTVLFDFVCFFLVFFFVAIRAVYHRLVIPSI